VVDNGITMCGFAPAVVALYAARALGADRSEIVDYTHSGMVTGDDAEVVSYAGVRIYRERA
jgi:AmmeMemoRadiSam system protein B